MPLKLNSTGGGSVTLDTPSTAGTYTVTVPATNQTLGLTSRTAQTAPFAAPNTYADFLNIPSWVKRITVMFNGVSTNGTSNLTMLIGGSGGLETTGYVASALRHAGSSNQSISSTTNFLITETAVASIAYVGTFVLATMGSNTWNISGQVMGPTAVATAHSIFGSKTLSDTLTQLRITTVNGTDTFDAGSINIMYEG